MDACTAVGRGVVDVGEDERGALSIVGIVVRSTGKVRVGAWACCADIMILWNYQLVQRVDHCTPGLGWLINISQRNTRQ